MLIDRTHRSWATISTVILALGIVSYIIYAGASDKGATGGSLPGLIYGVIGTAMMVFAGLLAARKQVPFWRLGSAQFWLRGHLWLGGLSFPFILFHAGFAFGGLLEQILMWVFVVVWASGFYGLAMQSLLPRLLTSRIERETFLAQVPYIRRRNRIMSDRMIFEHCGAIPLTDDPMQKELERLVRHGSKVKDLEEAGEKDSAREEKSKWTEHVNDFDLALFRDIAKISKGNGWIRTVNDLTPYLFDVYSVKGVSDLKEKPAEEEEKPKKGGSPLDQIKAGGPGGKKPSPLDQIKAGGKKASPLDQIKAGGAAAKPAGGGSPLDQIRAAQGAAPKPAGPDLSGLSPVDQIRAQGAFGSGGSAVPVAAPAASGSPLDMIRAQGAIGSGGAVKVAAAPAPRSPAKPKDEPQGPILAIVRDVDDEVTSISDLFEQKYGYSKELAVDVAGRTKPFLQLRPPNPNNPPAMPQIVRDVDAEVSSIEKLFIEKYGYDADLAADVAERTKPFLQLRQPNPNNPPPIPLFVPDVDDEVASIEKLFVKKYGYDPALAEEVAEKVRPFLKPDSEDPDKQIASIQDLLVEKYGYDPTLAEEVAEKVRPYVDGTADAAAAEAEAKEAAASKTAPASSAAPTGAAAPAAPAGPLSDNPIVNQIRAQGAIGSGGAKAPAAAAAAPKPKKAAAPKAIIEKKSTAKVPILRTKELREFYLGEVRPYLAGNPRQGRLASRRESNRAFSQMRSTLPVELHETLSALQARSDEHRQFAEQQRLHRWLHYWLALHIPFSMMLYVLMAVHIIMALRVVPFSFSILGG